MEFKLAYTLNNLAKYRARLGRHEESLEAACEAVALCQSHSETKWSLENQHEINERRAFSLNFRAKSLLHLRRFEEAITDAKDAVRIFRALGKQKNDRELAYSLCLQAQCLRHRYGYQEALSLLYEAKELYQTLGSCWSLDYAHCLRNMSKCLAQLRRPEDAYKAADESLSVHWKLKDTEPDKFHFDDFSSTLMVVVYCLTCLGRHEEACHFMHDVVEGRRELSKNNLAPNGLNLAISLCQLADCLHNLGFYDDAAMHIAEAEALRRRLGFDPERKADINFNLALSFKSLDKRLQHHKSRRGNDAGQEMNLYDSWEA